MSNSTTLKLTEIKKLTPKVNPGEALRNNFLGILGESFDGGEIRELIAKLKDKAMAGDAKAIKMVFDLMLKGGQTERDVPESQTVFVDSPGLDVLRKLVALTILRDTSIAMGTVSEITGLDVDKANGLVKHPWFQVVRDFISLTPAGRQAVG
jgi:hypothetical protein